MPSAPECDRTGRDPRGFVFELIERVVDEGELESREASGGKALHGSGDSRVGATGAWALESVCTWTIQEVHPERAAQPALGKTRVPQCETMYGSAPPIRPGGIWRERKSSRPPTLTRNPTEDGGPFGSHLTCRRALVDELEPGAHVRAMNKDQRNGIGQNIKGRIKEAAGAIVGNKKIEAEGDRGPRGGSRQGRGRRGEKRRREEARSLSGSSQTRENHYRERGGPPDRAVLPPAVDRSSYMPLNRGSSSETPRADGARGRASLTADALAKVRVFVADDHGILRGGLRALINLQPDMEVVGDAANGPDSESGIIRTEPDIVLMDISMPNGGGLAAIAAVKRIRPKTRIVVLTFHDELGYVRAARQAGAVGYIVKSAVDTELLAAIRAVARGRTFVDASLDLHLTKHQMRTTAGSAVGGPGLAPLTSRELEVMRRVAEGFTNAQVAEELGLGVKSVETYRSRIMSKLGLAGRVALVRFALECGVLAPGRSVP